MAVTSERIATFLDADHDGRVTRVDGVNSLERASSDDLAYCTQYDSPEQIRASEAGVLVAPTDADDHPGATLVRTPDPRTGFVLAADEFFRDRPDETWIHPSATVADEADVGPRCLIGAGAHVGPDVELGADCVVGPGTILGSDALIYARDDDDRLVKHVQRGRVVVGDRVHFGANCAVDRAMFEETVIDDGTKLDNFVHVAHDCYVGRHSTLTAGSMLAGHVHVGDQVRLNPEAAVGIFVTVGEGAEVGMNSTVIDDVEPYTRVVGAPAEAVGDSRFA